MTKRITKCFIALFYKTSRFYVAVRLVSNRLQMTSQCGKNIKNTLGYCLVFHLFRRSSHILTSSVIYWWTDARQLTANQWNVPVASLLTYWPTPWLTVCVNNHKSICFYWCLCFFVVVELLRSKDTDLRKILDEKSKLVAELRVKVHLHVVNWGACVSHKLSLIASFRASGNWLHVWQKP